MTYEEAVAEAKSARDVAVYRADSELLRTIDDAQRVRDRRVTAAERAYARTCALLASEHALSAAVGRPVQRSKAAK